MKKESFSKACELQHQIDINRKSLSMLLRMIDNDDSDLRFALVAIDRSEQTRTADITDIISEEWLQNIADTLRNKIEMLEWEFDCL